MHTNIANRKTTYNNILLILIIAVIGVMIAKGISAKPTFIFMILPIMAIAFIPNELFIVFTIWVMVQGFGLLKISRTFASINLSVGTINFLDLIFLYLLGIGIYTHVTKRHRWRKTQLDTPLILLILYTIFHIFGALFYYHESLKLVLNISRPLAYYLIYFVILTIISRKDKLDKFLKLLLGFCIFGVLFSFIQVFFKIKFATTYLEYQYGYGVIKYANYGTSLVNASLIVGLIFLLSRIKSRYRMGILIASIIAGYSLIFSHSRSSWTTTILAVIAGIVVIPKTGIIRKLSGVLIIVLSVILILFHILPVFNLTGLQERYLSTKTDFLGVKGSFATRILILQGQWQMAKNVSPLTGVGFRHQGTGLISSQFEGEWFTYATRGADSGLGYLILRMGLIGLFIFAFIFYRFFRLAWYVYKNTENSGMKTLVLGISLANLQLLSVLPFSDSLFHYEKSMIFITSWALIELIRRYYCRERKVK